MRPLTAASRAETIQRKTDVDVCRAKLGFVLIIDAANVIGSRPDGWWRDRAGAAARFVAEVRDAATAGRFDPPIVVVLEGGSRPGAEEGVADGVEVVHASGEGDEAIVALASADAVIVTADRRLADRVRAVGAEVVGPTWLLDRLGSG